MSLSKVIDAVSRHRRFLISGHVDPEADSIGSQLALASLLKRLGKKVTIINEDVPPASCAFIPMIETINTLKHIKREKLRTPDCVIVLDCPEIKRVGKVEELIPKGVPIINIDHHISNKKFGDINWVCPDAAAVGEMVFDIFREFKVEITKKEAVLIYSAILIDTGSFRYSNTTPRTHSIAAELIKKGLDTNAIYENLLEMRSYEGTRLLGLVLSNIRKNKTVVWSWITDKMLAESGARAKDIENFIDYLRAIKGCKVAVLFRITSQKGVFKVSIRGRGVDVNRIASKFGGGGHPAAAGCTIKADTSSRAEEKILKEIFLSAG